LCPPAKSIGLRRCQRPAHSPRKFQELGEGTDVAANQELPLISPTIADRLARRAPNSYMLSGKQMEVPRS